MGYIREINIAVATADKTSQKMTVQIHTLIRVLPSSVSGHQPFQIAFGQHRNFPINFRLRLPALRAPESTLLANGFFMKGDKTAKITENLIIDSNIIRSSLFCIKNLFYITKLYQNSSKKSMLCKTCGM